MKEKIVVLDGFAMNPGDLDWSPLAALGELEVFDRTPPELVVPRSKGAKILLTNKTVISGKAMKELPSLRFISVLATGYNIVDMPAAQKAGILVSNVPAYSSDSVAQLVFAYLLEWCQRAAAHSASVHAGEWAASPDFSYTLMPIHELAGQTLGIVGFGRIGRTAARIARGFGMRVLAVPHRPDAPPEDGAELVSLDAMLPQADFVTLHCPLTDETRGLVDAAFLAKMKPGAYLVNTARGPLVDETALANALKSGRLAGAAADVLSTEPPAPDNPLLAAPNMILTPHLAWATVEARRRLLRVTVENVAGFLAGKPVHLVK